MNAPPATRRASGLRRAALGAAAVAALGGAAALAVALLTGDRAQPAPSAPAAAPAPVPAPAPELASELAPPPPPAPPPPRPPRPQPWEDVAPTARAAALGPVGVAVAGDLVEASDALSECFDRAAQARGADPASTAEVGTPVLLLHLEAGAGEVRIADARLEARAGASDALVACAQRVLRGRVARAEGALPGRRYRLLFPLVR